MPVSGKAFATSAAGRSPRRWWQERAARGLVRLLAPLPLAVLHRLGAAIGQLIVLLPNRQRRNALINIALHAPQRPATELIRARNRSLRELGKTLFETALLWMRPPEAAVGLIREVRGGELLKRQPGRGLIVLSPHLGAWELAGLYLSTQGPTTIFYKPQRLLDELIVDARRRAGATLAPTTARGIRVLLNALERGEYAGILPDQEPREDKGAVYAPLFGIPAYTMLLVNRLARRSAAPVIFMIAERLPRAQGFRIHCLKAPDGIDSDDDVEAAAALNRGIEQCIAICPDQYLWSYRRFRRRPSGGNKVYTGPLRDQAAIDRARLLRAGN
ncbi:lysophospholipid acyltransferase family protein [Halochromatium glycolicum]|uniref:Lipid A biosynthesis acyltransferase n=1 Tax=Halochromatium glycolicum TaxID=85075 RepID=A0AAJ0U748_9GAMM|nr:lipid A biosynthesis acyltransferase [Halochromatium glycolicum]